MAVIQRPRLPTKLESHIPYRHCRFTYNIVPDTLHIIQNCVHDGKQEQKEAYETETKRTDT